jgi:hypothetical protein
MYLKAPILPEMPTAFKNVEKCSMSQTGWPDWVIFWEMGYFWRLTVIYWKDEVAQISGDFLATFCLSKFITFLHKKAV